ncbi:hypothetical protein CBOM_07674 [Ceraceosorus bombacis]|uniref:Uncharacterized protein n=1 Tax=Ceraceosorus bombacis TaxID=401625 RepID=A0A0P1BN40_9BASI|nr:hypothetical protein CBOM_07674 [Ceraceosorus bombacis]
MDRECERMLAQKNAMYMIGRSRCERGTRGAIQKRNQLIRKSGQARMIASCLAGSSSRSRRSLRKCLVQFRTISRVCITELHDREIAKPCDERQAIDKARESCAIALIRLPAQHIAIAPRSFRSASWMQEQSRVTFANDRYEVHLTALGPEDCFHPVRCIGRAREIAVHVKR